MLVLFDVSNIRVTEVPFLKCYLFFRGSILAGLDSFKKMWVSKREYNEEGTKAVHRKTF